MGNVEHSVTLAPGCSAGCRPLMTSPLTSAPRLSHSTSLHLYPPNLLHLWQPRESPLPAPSPGWGATVLVPLTCIPAFKQSACDLFVLAGQLTAVEEPDNQHRDTQTKNLKLSLSQVRGQKASRQQENVVDQTGWELSLMNYKVFFIF